jgi:hypothetical protein
MSMTNNTCNRCRYYDPQTGSCHRNPKTMMGWVMVAPLDWCGEWRPIEEPQQQQHEKNRRR